MEVLGGGAVSYERGIPVKPRCDTTPAGGKQAWSFYRTISGVRLCWELEEHKGPKGCTCVVATLVSLKHSLSLRVCDEGAVQEPWGHGRGMLVLIKHSPSKPCSLSPPPPLSLSLSLSFSLSRSPRVIVRVTW